MSLQSLLIEWRHLDKDGNTCARCADTGTALDAVVKQLAGECRPRGMDIRFKETRLDEGRIAESNSVFINGRPIDEILPGANTGMNHCESCCAFTGRDMQCRTLTIGGQLWEAIPESLLREAVCWVAECC